VSVERKGRKYITSNSNTRPRIAASSYLNTAPLIWSFTHGSRQNSVQLFTDEAPARCAEMLARDEVEAALVPVIEYQRITDVALVPGVCVGSHSAVRSVVIASKHDELRTVRRVALDDSSRTSVALVKIVFREFLGFEPEWQVRRPVLTEMLEENDAALIIGDPAMKIERQGLRIFDLATLWREHTGLGFVFAMWMARDGDAERIRAIDFAGARDEGIAHLDELVSSYESRFDLPRTELSSYLTENISFGLDEELRAGLELFFSLARKQGLVSNARSLKMLYQ
jgi:chorismate dehydratase